MVKEIETKGERQMVLTKEERPAIRLYDNLRKVMHYFDGEKWSQIEADLHRYETDEEFSKVFKALKHSYRDTAYEVQKVYPDFAKKMLPVYEATLIVEGVTETVLHFNDKNFEHAEMVFREEAWTAEKMDNATSISIAFRFAGEEEDE